MQFGLASHHRIDRPNVNCDKALKNSDLEQAKKSVYTEFATTCRKLPKDLHNLICKWDGLPGHIRQTIITLIEI